MITQALKYSVSLVVLLASLSSIDSSYAVDTPEQESEKGKIPRKVLEKDNESDQAEINNKFPKVPSALKGFLSPFKEKTISKSMIPYDPQALGLFATFDEELLRRVFSLFDFQTTVVAERVCKNWYYSLDDLKKQNRRAWEARKKGEDPQPLLTALLSHRSNILWIFNELASCCQVYYLGELQNIFQFSQDGVEKFAELICKLPIHQRFLSKLFLHLDPYDAQKTIFAYFILKECPEIQNILQQVSRLNPNLNDMLTNQQDHEATEETKSQLMALKLLAMNKDEEARNQIKTLESIVSQWIKKVDPIPLDLNTPEFYTLLMLQRIEQKNAEEFIRKNKKLFWGIYTISGEILKDLFHAICKIVAQGYGGQLDTQFLLDFGNYAFPLLHQGPNRFTSINQNQYHALINDLSYMQRGHSVGLPKFPPPIEMVFFVGKKLGTLLEKLPEFVGEIEQNINDGYYSEMLPFLREVYDQVQDSPYRFYVLYNMVRCLLGSQDPAQIQEAGGHIETLLRLPFDTDGNFQTPYVLSLGDQEEVENKDIDLDSIFLLKAVYHVTQGEFSEAHDALATYKGSYEDEWRLLLNVLRTQIEKIESFESSNKLRELLLKDGTLLPSSPYTPENLAQQVSFRRYAPVYEWILQKAPDAQKELFEQAKRKLEEENPWPPTSESS